MDVSVRLGAQLTMILISVKITVCRLATSSPTAPATLITRTAPAMEEAAYLVAELAPPPGGR